MPDHPLDPFTVLHRPVPTTRPRPQFVIALRQRLQEELDMSLTDATAPDARPAIEQGALGLIHLKVADGDRAMAFFGGAFGWVGERYDGDGHVSHYTLNTAVTVRLWDDPEAVALRPNFHVRDVGEAVRAIEANGGRVTEAATGWAWAEDAAGLPFLVYRPRNRYADHGDAPVSADVGLVFVVEPETAAASFYGPVLGWRFVPEHPGSRYFDTTARVGVFDDPGAPPSITLFLDVADLASAVAALERHGGRAVAPIPDEPDMGPYFTVRCTDDQGTAFGLMSLARG